MTIRDDRAPLVPDDVVWAVDGGTAGHASSLLVLPHAGGNAHNYAQWRELLSDDVRLLIGQYPGRGARFSEPLPRDIGELAEPVLRCLPEDTEDLVILGHSMGSLVAFEIARSLTRLGRPPRALIASSCRSPFLPNPSPVHAEKLTNEELVAAIEARGGTDHAILSEPEIREIILPAIRADFTIDDQYRCLDGTERLHCRILAIGGADDPIVPAEALLRWSEATDGPTATRFLPGGHFYFQQQPHAFIALVQELIGGSPARHE
ncbi:thioesterase II family protein [Streptomyces sp. FL07-04A]|uniref:thioesterase II family protein n=1 Tax=Streptomyces sp. FL07-04A TaxID=3028658 RepID=UPI0029ADA44F|nr:alpha/beta fold hydrolase [Streptomyces sp. FL07-04A]MDX3578136.1 alpha/beta fold hydrolase [Streptomyces sp. FL07-04A]